jgi:hypothetical protein
MNADKEEGVGGALRACFAASLPAIIIFRNASLRN